MQGDNEQSIHLLENYLGQKVQIIAFGASYIGILEEVDYEKGFLILSDKKDRVTLDLDRVEFYAPISS